MTLGRGRSRGSAGGRAMSGSPVGAVHGLAGWDGRGSWGWEHTVDELEQRRRRRHGLPGGQQAPEEELTSRDRAAQRDDVVADTRDDRAKVADRDADSRDRAAEERDATADDRDADVMASGAARGLPADRVHARSDREQAARDRGKAVDDRGRARRDRKLARQGRERAADDRGAAWDAVVRLRELLSEAEDNAEDMLVIGQAQGRIMTARAVGPAEALLELCARANRDEASLGEAARSIVADPAR